MTTQVTPEFRPYVAELNGALRTNSLRVAEHFGKRHDNVVDRIRKLGCSEDFRLLNFKETSQDIDQPNGGARSAPIIEMTKDGFMLLAMGFTGPAAMRIKEAYIAEFNRMEAELRRPALPGPVTPIDWPTLVRASGVTAMARELANNCTLKHWDGRVMVLALPEKHAHIHVRRAEANIEKALGDYFGHPIQLVIERTDSPQPIPAPAPTRQLLTMVGGQVVRVEPVPEDGILVSGQALLELYRSLDAYREQANAAIRRFCGGEDLERWLEERRNGGRS